MEVETQTNNDNFNWTTDDEAFSDTTQPDYDEYYDSDDELVNLTRENLSVSYKDLHEKYQLLYAECCRRLELVPQIKPFTFELIELRIFLEKLKGTLNYILHHYKLEKISNFVVKKQELLEVISVIGEVCRKPTPFNEHLILQQCVWVFERLFSFF
jgi:hypothetical protein